MKKQTRIVIGVILFLLATGIAQGEQRIIDIVYRGDAQTLERVQSRVDNFRVQTGEGDSLVIVCLKGYLARKRDDAGTTPLHIAAQTGDVETADLLLRSGANPAAWNRQGEKPYSLALKNGHSRCAQKILSSLSRENTDQLTSRYASTLSLLIQNNAPVNTYDSKGTSALMYAVEARSAEMVTLLVDNDADPSYTKHPDGKNALHMAVEKCETDIVQVLLKNKKLINRTWRRTVEEDEQSADDEEQYARRYKRPDEYNLSLAVYSELSDPGNDRRCFYKVYIDKEEAGRTVTGLESQKKVFTAMVEPNRHLVQIEKYVLDKKKEKYVKLNNIYQPKPGHLYVEIHENRIRHVNVKHVADGETVYTSEYVKE